MSDGSHTRKVSTQDAYVQAIWDGFKVVGQGPPPSSRDQTHATLGDLDAALASLKPTGGTASITGPTLPALASGTRYVWTKTDPVTGDLLDIVTGVAP